MAAKGRWADAFISSCRRSLFSSLICPFFVEMSQSKFQEFSIYWYAAVAVYVLRYTLFMEETQPSYYVTLFDCMMNNQFKNRPWKWLQAYIHSQTCPRTHTHAHTHTNTHTHTHTHTYTDTHTKLQLTILRQACNTFLNLYWWHHILDLGISMNLQGNGAGWWLLLLTTRFWGNTLISLRCGSRGSYSSWVHFE